MGRVRFIRLHFALHVPLRYYGLILRVYYHPSSFKTLDVYNLSRFSNRPCTSGRFTILETIKRRSRIGFRIVFTGVSTVGGDNGVYFFNNKKKTIERNSTAKGTNIFEKSLQRRKLTYSLDGRRTTQSRTARKYSGIRRLLIFIHSRVGVDNIWIPRVFFLKKI